MAKKKEEETEKVDRVEVFGVNTREAGLCFDALEAVQRSGTSMPLEARQELLALQFRLRGFLSSQKKPQKEEKK